MGHLLVADKAAIGNCNDTELLEIVEEWCRYLIAQKLNVGFGKEHSDWKIIRKLISAPIRVLDIQE